jgi:hypothetical protein
MVTRTKRGFLLPTERLTLSITSASALPLVPFSVHDALINLNWRRTMEDEFVAFIANNNWDLVPHAVGSSFITSKWIFKHKFNSDVSLEWYKAC